jgi:hypothetical protein
MGKGKFGKLKRHIGRTGNYEPIVVREHPRRAGCYEIINGHSRVAVLKELGYGEAECVVWDVGDEEAMVLLATLNRLGGKDDVHRRGRLVRRLCRRRSVREIVRFLPEGGKTIERLRGLRRSSVKVREKSKAFLNPVVFFVDDGEKEVLEGAICEAMKNDREGTSAEKRRRAIVRICGDNLNGRGR